MRRLALLPILLLAAPALRAQTPAPAPPAAPACPRGAADDRSILVGADVALAPSALLDGRVDSTLVRLGFAVSAEESRMGQWVTRAAHRWPAGVDTTSWQGAAHPGVQVVVDVAAADGAGRAGRSSGPTTTTRLQVAAGAVCRVALADSAAAAEVETALETFTAVEVANAILRAVTPAKPAAQPPH
jgi:hypothetical protein